MPNILLHGVEIAAEDALKLFSGAKTKLAQIEAAEPQVVAGLGTLLGAASSAMTATAAAASAPVNIALDAAAVAALRVVWPDVVTFVATLGIKL